MASKKSVKKNNSDCSSTALALTFEDSIQPRSDAYLLRVGQELILWAEQPKSITINQFIWHYRLPRRSFYEWVKKFPLSFYYEQALTALAARREEKAFFKEASEGIFTKSAMLYDPQWKELAKEEANIKARAMLEALLERKEIEEQPALKELIIYNLKQLAGESNATADEDRSSQMETSSISSQASQPYP